MSTIVNYLPIASTVLMFIFAASVLQRYVVRRNPAFLFWGIGLLMFGIGSFAEVYLNIDWSRLVFISWYLFGAILNPAWIGQGTLYLLVKKPWVHVVTGIVVIASIAATIMMFTIPIHESAFQHGIAISQQYRTRGIIPAAIFKSEVLAPTIVFGTYGLITLVGGALYSAFLFWRKRVLPNRVIGNIMIAVGALSVAFTSVLTGLGLGQYLYVGELIAAVFMYSGFLVAAGPKSEPVIAEQPAAATAG